MKGLQHEAISRLEFSAGRLWCGPIRSYLDRQCMKAKKIGSFQINRFFVDEAILSGDYSLCGIFGEFLPIKVEYDEAMECFTYTGYSASFKKVKEGHSIPMYTVRLTSIPDQCDYQIEFVPADEH